MFDPERFVRLQKYEPKIVQFCFTSVENGGLGYGEICSFLNEHKMSKFAKFMKANKAVKENGFYPATKSLCDEKGNPLDWEFKHISSKENEELRDVEHFEQHTGTHFPNGSTNKFVPGKRCFRYEQYGKPSASNSTKNSADRKQPFEYGHGNRKF